MTVNEVIKEEARKFGLELTDAEAEFVAWEHTGYPAFWPICEATPTPEACLRAQVREWAEGVAGKGKR